MAKTRGIRVPSSKNLKPHSHRQPRHVTGREAGPRVDGKADKPRITIIGDRHTRRCKIFGIGGATPIAAEQIKCETRALTDLAAQHQMRDLLACTETVIVYPVERRSVSLIGTTPPAADQL